MTEWEKKHQKDWVSYLERMIDEMMQDFSETEGFDQPLVYGFTVKKSPDGPVFEEFGNVRHEDGKAVVSEYREPLVDVIEAADSMTITAELPGARKDAITVRSPNRHMVIIQVKGEPGFYKKLEFDTPLKPGSAQAHFNNGILEIKIRTLKPKAGQEIKVK